MFKYLVCFMSLSMLMVGSYAAESQRARPGMSGRVIMSAPRATVSSNQFGATSGDPSAVATKTTVVADVKTAQEVDRREAERFACEANNIGIGNTFVWASRYSNTFNYSSMVEDVENPANNVCFVKVELKSDNSKVSVSDVEPKYFMWGESITCGSWANEEKLRQRILDAGKGAYVGTVVASTVGGLGLGVGAMELFGNKLIGGKVEGQKSLSGEKLYRSQLLVLKEKEPYKFEQYRQYLSDLKEACEDPDKKETLKKHCGSADCCAKYRDLIAEFAL